MKKTACLFCVITVLFAASCSFDYDTDSENANLPDLVMENVEYVRVRSADPVAQIQAERAERYEEQRIMKIQNFSFEQYGNSGREVNTTGKVGNATVDIETGDILMENDIRIEVTSEDITIETQQLEWKDGQRLLYTRDNGEVYIYQPDGTNFTGTGLHVNARSREWSFSGNTSGTYIYEEEDGERQ
jgi:LPS export ABC transporter protein LptC